MPAPDLGLSDILAPELYERVRIAQAPFLRRHKAARRVELGRYLCVLFESRATVLGQIHEIIRVEGRTRASEIQREIDEYACLVPRPGWLTATLAVHAGPAELGVTLSREIVSGRGPILLEVDGYQSACRALRPTELAPAAIHYIGFEIPTAMATKLRASRPTFLRLRSAIGDHDLPLPEALHSALVDTLAVASGEIRERPRAPGRGHAAMPPRGARGAAETSPTSC